MFILHTLRTAKNREDSSTKGIASLGFRVYITTISSFILSFPLSEVTHAVNIRHFN